MIDPRYPGVRVRLRSANTLALVAAVRIALRRAGVAKEEINQFSCQALQTETEADRVRVCRQWADVEVQPGL